MRHPAAGKATVGCVRAIFGRRGVPDEATSKRYPLTCRRRHLAALRIVVRRPAVKCAPRKSAEHDLPVAGVPRVSRTTRDFRSLPLLRVAARRRACRLNHVIFRRRGVGRLSRDRYLRRPSYGGGLRPAGCHVTV